jgi:hypothetical protein
MNKLGKKCLSKIFKGLQNKGAERQEQLLGSLTHLDLYGNQKRHDAKNKVQLKSKITLPCSGYLQK